MANGRHRGQAARMAPRLGPALLLFLAVIVPAAPAAAAPTWLAPVDVSAPGQDADQAQVAVDAQGNATAVWRRTGGAGAVVQTATRAAGGAWQTPTDLSAPGPVTPAQVAIDAQGNATAVWTRYDGAHLIVQAATRAAGGAWQPSTDLSTPGHDADQPQIAIDPQGNATAVWTHSDGAHFIVQAATRAAGGAWQTATDLSAPGKDAIMPQVAVDTQGTVTAVWSRDAGTHSVVQAATRAAGGAWPTPTDLSTPGQNAQQPQLAIDAQGNPTVVWTGFDGSNDIVQAATRATGGAWPSPSDLSAPGQNAFGPQIAVDALGNAAAVWRRSDGTNEIIQAATRATGGAWQAPTDLSTPGRDAQNPQIGFVAPGTAIAVWEGFNAGGNVVIQTATRAAGGAWQTATELSAPGQNAHSPQIAFGPEGNATAVWDRSNSSNDIVQSAGFDAAAPLLNALSIPVAGVAGQPLSFSVSPFDVWSPLPSTTWSFGDSATATGTTASHTYSAAGTPTVTVTATDAVGNASSTTRTITIGPAAPVPVAPGPVAPTPAPQISRARLTHPRFRVARQPTAVTAAKAAKPARGSAFVFTLSSEASVKIAITRKTTGLRKGNRCVGPTRKLQRAHAKHCTRTIRVGTLTRANLTAATQRIAFSGRIGRRALVPHAFTATLIASNAAGRSRATRLAFTILRG
jgi:hypothetical protein